MRRVSGNEKIAADRGRVALENTHPFGRELWGRPWTFAHNGQLKGVKKLPLGRHRVRR